MTTVRSFSLPAPRAALRHSIPTVFEGLVAPVAVFYLTLLAAGFRGALIAAFVWSAAAMLRRVIRRERVSTVLVVGMLLLALRTVVSFVTKSPTLYFVSPMVSSVVVSIVLSARPSYAALLTQRFAEDFCPGIPGC